VKRLRVAVIGCGQITQWMHIPYLRELEERYEIVAACDISAKTVEKVADYFQIPGRYTDYQQLLDEVHPDVCLIATLDHYPPAIAAVEAGAHVLVEKPMCWLRAEAEHLVARAGELGRIVQVGYHKRYDPNYQRALELMQKVEKRRTLYLRCIIGPNARYTDDFWPTWRYDDAPKMPSTSTKIRQELGADAPDNFVSAYGLMGGLSTHTYSIFRGLYLEVPTVHGCVVAPDGMSYSAVMETSDGVIVTMDCAVIDVKSFDEEMSLFGRDNVVKVNFPSPYLKNAETRVMMKTMQGKELLEQHFMASNEEAYKREWVALYEAIVNGGPVLTPGAEGIMDLDFNRRLLDAAKKHA
jgi:predicted dehydrogenase